MKAIVVAAASLFALTALSGLAAGHDLPYSVLGPAGPYAQGVTGYRGETGSGGQFDCGLGNHPVLNLSLGGVCFGAGAQWGYQNGNHDKLDQYGNPAGSTEAQHLTAKATNRLDIHDSTDPEEGGHVLGVYCQDLNDDWLCGGAWDGEPQGGQCELPPGWNDDGPHLGGLPEGTSICPLRSEPYFEFCDSITIVSGLDGPLPGNARRRAGLQWNPQDGTWAEANLPTWKVSSSVFVFIPNPNQGNANLTPGNGAGGNACGPISASSPWGTAGTISHQ